MDKQKVININELINELNEGTIKENNINSIDSYDDKYDDKYDDYVDFACCGPWSH